MSSFLWISLIFVMPNFKSYKQPDEIAEEWNNLEFETSFVDTISTKGWQNLSPFPGWKSLMPLWWRLLLQLQISFSGGREVQQQNHCWGDHKTNGEIRGWDRGKRWYLLSLSQAKKHKQWVSKSRSFIEVLLLLLLGWFHELLPPGQITSERGSNVKL